MITPTPTNADRTSVQQREIDFIEDNINVILKQISRR